MAYDPSLTIGINPQVLAGIDPGLLEDAEVYGLQEARDMVDFLHGQNGEADLYLACVDPERDPLSVVRHGAFIATLGLPQLPDVTTIPPDTAKQRLIVRETAEGIIRRDIFLPRRDVRVERDHTGKLLPVSFMTVSYLAVRSSLS